MDLKDLAHRVVWTGIETFTGFLVAEPIIQALGGSVDLDLLHTAVGTALASSLVVVKEYARKQLAARRDA